MMTESSNDNSDDPDQPGGFFQKLGHRLRTALGLRNGDISLRETLELVIEEHGDDGVRLGDEERLMLFNLIEAGDLDVDDVMVPRLDIVAVDESASLDEVLEIFRVAKHSRLPVFKETLDNVSGFLHIKDFLEAFAETREGKTAPGIAELARPILFVPPATPIFDLLAKMRGARLHMAVVVDEYGGIDGLITIEDLIEEIVGEIKDEHDEIVGPAIRKLADGGYEVDARVEIEVLQEVVGQDLALASVAGEIDTVGGLVIALAGRVPRLGEIIKHPVGLEFKVAEGDSRRVKKLTVRTAR